MTIRRRSVLRAAAASAAGLVVLAACGGPAPDRGTNGEVTGEISLRGLVLPVGGIKEKVLAAARAGIETVLLPARNQKDIEDVPQAAREKIRFVWIERVDQAIEAALPDTEAISA